MTPARDPALATFLRATEAAVLADAAPGSPEAAAAERVFDRARDHTGTPGEAHGLPAPEGIGAALTLAATPFRRAVSEALAPLVPRLGWYRRSHAAPGAEAFAEGHANAVLLGKGGLEERDDLLVGMSYLAPGLTYPDHDHAPEEVYLALTAGEWWNAGMDWTDPGPAGLIYNPPGIRHAMRSGASPFLAVWLLPV